MSQLYLVRHGQASFFAENYDRLSAIGELQARRLGEFFAARRIRFDAVYSGQPERQQRTAEIVLQTMMEAGISSPDPIIVEGLNEHSGDKLLSKQYAQAFLERYPELAELEKAFCEAVEPEAVQKGFQKLFEAIVSRWTKGEVIVPGVESWQSFYDRALRALNSIIADRSHGRAVLAVSSVGPISVALHSALQTPLPVSLELGWRLRNASVTSFLYTAGKMTLDSFNSVAHLANPDEITYR